MRKETLSAEWENFSPVPPLVSDAYNTLVL